MGKLWPRSLSKTRVFGYNMTITPHDHQPQASYDSDGNIVIRVHMASAPVEEKKSEVPLIPLISAETAGSSHSEAVWETVEEEFPTSPEGADLGVVQEERLEVRTKFRAMSDLLSTAAAESAAQVQETVTSSQELLRDAGSTVNTASKRMWAFLSEPLTVPGRKKGRELSRTTLFIWDVFRFGGTFAGIFLVLFTALNAQSFWQISVSTIMPFIEPPSLELNEGTPTPAQAQASGNAQGLLAYLPTVGPPVNMVIIPKLKIAAPLVQPPTEALLQQDWGQVEKDIQESLLNGIVHYPGTAKPGQAGNFFITGHSSNYGWVKSQYNSIFARLHQLNVGDEYWVYWNGDRHRYIVRSKKEVSPSDVSVLDQPPDERMGTLMTCTPVGTTLRRLIVQAQEVDPDSLEPMKVGEKTERAPVPYSAQMLPI